MPKYIKLLKSLQLNSSAMREIEEVAAWLSVTVRENVTTNSRILRGE